MFEGLYFVFWSEAFGLEDCGEGDEEKDTITKPNNLVQIET